MLCSCKLCNQVMIAVSLFVRCMCLASAAAGMASGSSISYVLTPHCQLPVAACESRIRYALLSCCPKVRLDKDRGPAL